MNIFALLLLGLAFAGLCVHGLHVMDEEQAVQQKLQKLLTHVDSIEDLEVLQKQQQSLLSLDAALKTHLVWKDRPIVLLNWLLEQAPTSLVLSQLNLSKERLFLAGRVVSHSQLHTFMQALDRSPFLEIPDLERLQQHTSSTGGYQFQVSYAVVPALSRESLDAGRHSSR